MSLEVNIMKKLDFMIVGTMKSGTTSLAFQLNHNPDICMPPSEIHYFNYDENFSKGEKWYETHFKDCDQTCILGEKTPTYSYLEKIPKRIFEYNPEIKLIWMFRNPIDRAYSNYYHAKRAGNEKYSFKKAIRLEPERIKNDIFKGYLTRSKYIEQVERYLEYFSIEQMHFILFEDFVKNPINVIKDIFKFLEVPFNDFEYQDEIKNVARIPRAPRFLKKSREILGETALLYRIIRKLSFIGRKTGYKKMSPRLREQLDGYFEVYNKQLGERTGLDISIWQTKK